MSKQKAFKRKLKQPKQGFCYWRIWGNPITNPDYHQSLQAPLCGVFEHPILGWFVLRAEYSIMSNTKYKMLDGSLANRYFKKAKAAQACLRDYELGRTSEGLAELARYHTDFDDVERLFLESWGKLT